jgi:hypothetical protein
MGGQAGVTLEADYAKEPVLFPFFDLVPFKGARAGSGVEGTATFTLPPFQPEGCEAWAATSAAIAAGEAGALFPAELVASAAAAAAAATPGGALNIQWAKYSALEGRTKGHAGEGGGGDDDDQDALEEATYPESEEEGDNDYLVDHFDEDNDAYSD